MGYKVSGEHYLSYQTDNVIKKKNEDANLTAKCYVATHCLCLISATKSEGTDLHVEGGFAAEKFHTRNSGDARTEPEHGSATSILVSIVRHYTRTQYFKYRCHLGN